MEIDSMTSVAMVLKYWYNRKATDEEKMKLALIKYHQNRQNNLNRGAMYYRLYNLDYQNTQKYFNLGCDFRILTSTFKDIEVYPLSMPISIKAD